MNWLLAMCIGYSLGVASVSIAVCVGQRLKETREIMEMDDCIRMMQKEFNRLQRQAEEQNAEIDN